MAIDLRGAVIENMKEIKKAIFEKSSEVAQLQKELKRHETVLALVTEDGKGSVPAAKKSRRTRTGVLGEVLTRLPDSFTSREFMRAATRTKRSPIYLRQLLSRWARQGKIKRVQRGKYQKTKTSNAHRPAA
jgi:hypothetical protein